VRIPDVAIVYSVKAGLMLAVLALLAGSCGGGSAAPAPAGGAQTVERVVDGDTIQLTNGDSVRLVQIDTPELDSGECYAQQARTALLRLVPEGSAVRLERDPRLDDVDRFGRLLRYIRFRGTNINLEVVRRGAAAPYFYRGDRGRFADQFLMAARAAKRHHRGLWGSCPGTRLEPDRQVETSL
jgi:endonuclease YncB( thermonuclease family)